MRADLRKYFLAVVLALGLTGSVAADELPLAARIMAGIAALPDRSARFTEENHVASLSAPVATSGMLVFQHPAHLEKFTESPRPEKVVIDGGMLTITTPDGPERRVALDRHPALGAMAATITATLAGDLPTLQRFYVVDPVGTLAAWRLTLRPRDEAVARFIRAVTLDGTGKDLRAVRIDQVNGDTQAMAIQPAS